MKKARIIILALLVLCTSCLENPLSYPRLKGEILALEVEGQKSLTIDSENMIVNIVLEENAEINNLKVTKYAYTEASTPSVALPEYLDLTTPFKISYTTHPDQTYEWTIQATQPIQRYVKCDNMVGDPVFDLENKTIMAYFPENQSLSSIRFTKMKLEAKGSKILTTEGSVMEGDQAVIEEESVKLPMTLECVISRKFKVDYKGNLTEWTFTAVHKVVNLEITGVSAWCYRADIYAAFKGEGTPVIQFKDPDSDEWTSLETKIDGTNLSASVEQLDEATSYVARVVNGTEISDEFPFTTEEPVQLPNMSFDDWHQGNPGGYTWHPSAADGEMVWTTANAGVNMMSAVNATRPESTFVAKKGGAAARLESTKVFGMFAAGNILTGEFLKATISGGVGAELTWGTPFTTRPYSLRGYMSYSPKVIDNASDKNKDKIGTMDKAQILVMLTDWDEPFLIKTASETFVDKDKDPHIIALGTIETDVNSNGKYEEFECVLEYRDTLRKPKYVVVAACSSLYGDYFTGGLGSVLYVDEFEFIYQ